MKYKQPKFFTKENINCVIITLLVFSVAAAIAFLNLFNKYIDARIYAEALKDANVSLRTENDKRTKD